MKDEGYLVRGKGSQFHRVDSTEQAQKRDRDYANPTTLLSHLVSSSLCPTYNSERSTDAFGQYEVADEVRPRKRVKST